MAPGDAEQPWGAGGPRVASPVGAWSCAGTGREAERQTAGLRESSRSGSQLFLQGEEGRGLVFPDSMHPGDLVLVVL